MNWGLAKSEERLLTNTVVRKLSGLKRWSWCSVAGDLTAVVYVQAFLDSTSWLCINPSSLEVQIGFWNKRSSCSHLSRTLRERAWLCKQGLETGEEKFWGLWVSFTLGVITNPPHLSEFCQEEIRNVSLFNEPNILGVISTVAQTPQRAKMLMKLLMKDRCITQCGREREGGWVRGESLQNIT